MEAMMVQLTDEVVVLELSAATPPLEAAGYQIEIIYLKLTDVRLALHRVAARDRPALLYSSGGKGARLITALLRRVSYHSFSAASRRCLASDLEICIAVSAKVFCRASSFSKTRKM